jgi:hypothetical protein
VSCHATVKEADPVSEGSEEKLSSLPPPQLNMRKTTKI